jgi:ubiquinone/menaquinone biosynthesis C-methylase UbiE
MNKSNFLVVFFVFIIFTFCLVAQSSTLKFDMQHVTVNDFKANGYILDIGGGGEGTIGRLKGSQVIAIDISKRELEEAPDGPLKIIMDARELHFLDETFNTVTSFFTLMYINGNDHEKVFSEAFRVLKPGGKFLIWDAIIPKDTTSVHDRVIVPLTIKLPQAV